MLTKDFIQAVVTCREEGYFCLALRKGGVWLEEWHRWPDDIDKIVERAAKHADEADVYFSSYIFRAPQSVRENVLPTRTIQADLDDAELTHIPREPTILVETSPGRHQGYWILDRELPLEDHENLSRKLTYSIPLCDRSGWPLGRKVRVPGTKNHKYLSGTKDVHVVRATNKTYDPEEFEALPEVPQFLVEHFDSDFAENPQEVSTPARELLEQIKTDIPVRIYIQYDQEQADRSEALWSLMCWGFKAGLTREQVFTLSRESANNKFKELRHRGDQSLAKDVLRAEHTIKSAQQDPKQLIADLYKNSLSPLERRRDILKVVLNEMRSQGEFFHTNNGFNWYVRRDIGRPIMVTAHSEQLQTLLDIQFGLNPTETEARYVAHGLKSYVTNLPDTAIQSSLSYYDPVERHLLIHTGRRAVIRVTTAGVDNMVDGAYNVIFPWAQSVHGFTPSNGGDSIGLNWADELFGDGERGYGSSVENITNMTPEQAMSLLKVWFMFVLFREAASSRPIIAALGQPGSGKSFMFKKVYALLYGPYKSISAVTNMDDFDHSTASDPLVVLDNVDTWEKWLPDRLALSAGKSDVIRRKLYTDADTVTLRRQAIIGVTAHNPKFGREDVADRFLLLAYRRLDHFESEERILSDILRKRNIIWGAIVKDAVRVMNTPIPTSGIPQFRIEDFARFGLWIARALGCEKHFRDAIEDVKSAQQAFSLEEEGLLVSAIRKFAEAHRNKAKHYTSAELWNMLAACSDDSRVFQSLYRNSVSLAKKLSSMQVSLRKIVVIEQSFNESGTKTWMIAPLNTESEDE